MKRIVYEIKTEIKGFKVSYKLLESEVGAELDLYSDRVAAARGAAVGADAAAARGAAVIESVMLRDLGIDLARAVGFIDILCASKTMPSEIRDLFEENYL